MDVVRFTWSDREVVKLHTDLQNKRITQREAEDWYQLIRTSDSDFIETYRGSIILLLYEVDLKREAVALFHATYKQSKVFDIDNIRELSEQIDIYQSRPSDFQDLSMLLFNHTLQYEHKPFDVDTVMKLYDMMRFKEADIKRYFDHTCVTHGPPQLTWIMMHTLMRHKDPLFLRYLFNLDEQSERDPIAKMSMQNISPV